MPPEIHVFLPEALMHLPIDCWQAERNIALGHRFKVLLHLSERYQDSYCVQSDWKRVWQRFEQVRENKAEDSFLAGHDADLESFEQALKEIIDNDTKVGLEMSEKPDNVSLFCGDIYESGIPIAVWHRETHATLQEMTGKM